MKRYEMIREIFNNCSGNQMRDVYFEEVETDDPEACVLEHFQDPDATFNLESTSEGSWVFTVESHGLRQRVSFTEI
ncbi:MAG: hypothetical protein GX111_02315 [Clostridiales bacterium]|nr:hypothetical protein [Clostridiales bacterium]